MSLRLRFQITFLFKILMYQLKTFVTLIFYQWGLLRRGESTYEKCTANIMKKLFHLISRCILILFNSSNTIKLNTTNFWIEICFAILYQINFILKNTINFFQLYCKF